MGRAALPQLVRNAASLLLAYVLPRFATLAAVIVAARVLGTARFGAYGTAAAFAVLMSVLATLGMMPLLIREIARSPGDAPGLLRAAHLVKTASNAVMLAVLLALAAGPLDLEPQVLAAALLLGLAYAVGAYGENLAAYFQAVERMHVWTEASAIFGLIAGGLGALLVVTTRSLAWFCAATLLGQLAELGWLLARAPAAVRRGRPATRAEVAALLRALAPFAGAFIALTVYYKIDVLLLARWRPAADVGIYSAAYKAIDIAQALALVAAGAVYPQLSRAAGPEAAGLRLAGLALLVTVPAAALLWLGRGLAIGLAFGDAYAAAAPVLAVLAAVIPPLGVNMLAGYVLGAAGRMKLVAAAYAGAATLNVALNAWLIPAHGARGPALAMLASETALAAVLLLALRSGGDGRRRA